MRSSLRSYLQSQRPQLYGKYRGICVDRDDPDGRKRIRARVPRVQENFMTVWALPCGVFSEDYSVPEVGDQVWIEFEGGDARFPIWSFGLVPLGRQVDAARFARPTNQESGVRFVGHQNGSGVVLDGTRGNERAYLRDMTGNSRIGISSLNDSVFFIGDADGIMSLKGNLIERFGGSRDSTIGGNESIAIAGNAQKGIAGDSETTVGKNDLKIVMEEHRVRSAKKHVLDVINSLLLPIAGITIELVGTGGAAEILVQSQGQIPGKIKLDGSGALVKLEIEVTGDVSVKTNTGNIDVETNAGNVTVKTNAGKVQLSGAPFAGVGGGVLHANTIDRFTGTPFGVGPVAGSISVEASG